MNRRVWYLLRFDDLCPTLNWAIWEKIEDLLLSNGVKPLLAIVPDNRDPVLKVCPARADFWDRARAWQIRGWTIALHGYQHLYVTRCRGLVGRRPLSEFAGLPEKEQVSKLQKAIAIFRQEGIEPHVWIAPGHTFDSTTTHLLGMLGIRVISDGFWRWPHREKNGQFWIPQQLSDRIRPVPLGVWTVCYHVNKWTAAEVNRLSQDLATWHGQISSVPEIEEQFGECPGTWFRENFKSGLIRYYPMALTLKLYEKLLPRFVRLGA